MLTDKKKKLVVANFKMNPTTLFELRRWIENFSSLVEKYDFKKTNLALCPPFVFLVKMMEMKKKGFVFFGAQNCFALDKGPFTGEVSPKMLKELGSDFVILGHSERKNFLGETDEMISKKLLAALKERLQPVLCIGENESERSRGISAKVISLQLKNYLSEVPWTKLENLTICYEPVWAISANRPNRIPSANDIMEAKIIIKKILINAYGERSASRVKIIYGGSVDSKNIKEVCLLPEMDGVLCGKASLDPRELLKIAQEIEVKQ